MTQRKKIYEDEQTENIPSVMEALQQLSHEQHVDELVLTEMLEASMAKSYKKYLNTNNDLSVTLDRHQGRIYVFELVPVEESWDDELGAYTDFEEVDVTPADVSRYAARSAKSAMKHLLDDNRNMNIYNDFKDRIGDLIIGTVVQDTAEFTVVKINEGIEAELPHYNLKKNPEELNERPRKERYRKGQQLKAVIIDVRDPSENQQVGRTRPLIVVSRARPEFVSELLEDEIPEIYEGSVVVKGIVRNPGVRTKISVAAHGNQYNVDPVGACIGTKGNRIRAIVEELNNERVEIVRYSDDPEEYILAALGMKRDGHVILNESSHEATVIVPDNKMSAVIGRDGENARLTANLTRWKINIKSESFALKNGGYTDLFFSEDKETEKFDGICVYTTADGHRCRNRARQGSRYCGVHQSEEDLLTF